MVFEKINGSHHSIGQIKTLSSTAKKLLALFPLNMVAHLLTVLLVKVDTQKKY